MSEPGIDWKRLDNDSFLALISTEKRAFDFCFKFGLIDQSRRCNCGRQMEIQINRQEKHGLHFVCTASRSICSKKRTMLADTFFYRARISIRTCLKCIAGYAVGLTSDQVFFYTGIRSSGSIASWINFFRDICCAFVDGSGRHKIGGIECTVEIDETLIFKRKSNVGRLLSNEISGTWIFGGICRETGDAFIVPVANRNTEPLLRALYENVLPGGTHIISDCWRAYNELLQIRYRHSKINHSFNFVDPEDPSINTQRIERMWKCLKSTIPKECNPELRWTYLVEFLFKQRNKWYSLTVGERIVLILKNLKNLKFN
jgi:hypothetical protein